MNKSEHLEAFGKLEMLDSQVYSFKRHIEEARKRLIKQKVRGEKVDLNKEDFAETFKNIERNLKEIKSLLEFE